MTAYRVTIRRLADVLDTAIVAQQDVIRQLVRVKAEVARLCDEADIDDRDIWMTDADIAAAEPVRGER